MKRFFYFILLPFLSLAGIAYWLSMSHAQSPEPRSVLDKAIEAHGGAMNLAKARTGTLKGKTEGKGSEITQEESFDLPKRWKRVTSATLEGKRLVSFDLMIDGKFWQWDEGMEPRETPNKANAQPYFALLTILVDLTQEKIMLSRLQKTKVNGESAVGFRANWDRAEADYYFDEKTGLLVQSVFTFQLEPGKGVESKTVYGDFHEADGVKLPRRRTTYIKGGEFKEFVLMTDYVVTEVSIPKAIGDEVFALPGKK